VDVSGCSTTGNDLPLMCDDAPHCLRCVRLDYLVVLLAGDANAPGRRIERAVTDIVVRFSVNSQGV
jgi:hypothetical protein